MKIRTDFVTNSSSSSYITIVATKTDGTEVKDSLESDGFCEHMIFFENIKSIVGPKTEDGKTILKNIQKMYNNPRIDYLLDKSGDEHPLKEIKSLRELTNIKFTEEIEGDLMDCVSCVDEDGEYVFPQTASVVVSYDVLRNKYSKMKYIAEDDYGMPLVVKDIEE